MPVLPEAVYPRSAGPVAKVLFRIEVPQKGAITGYVSQETILGQPHDAHIKTTTLALQDPRQPQVFDRPMETVS